MLMSRFDVKAFPSIYFLKEGSTWSYDRARNVQEVGENVDDGIICFPTMTGFVLSRSFLADDRVCDKRSSKGNAFTFLEVPDKHDRAIDWPYSRVSRSQGCITMPCC